MADPMIAALQGYFGVEHIVPAGRASIGIAAALRVWGGEGGVAVPASVCQDVIAAVLLSGRQPVFCDVVPATGLVPDSEWRRARHAGAEAAIVVHLYGNPADTAAVRAVFPDGLLIDDAAQALGAQTPQGLAGTGGDVGVVSFGHTKHIEVGGAALLCRDEDFARACAAQLQNFPITAEADIQHVEWRFRAGFEAARARLRETGENDSFHGLLSGYGPALQVAWNPAWSAPIATALADYPDRLVARQAKAALWAQAVEHTGLIAVGMGAQAAPWRYACRMPGVDWAEQHRLAEALRGRGLHVSHWYLPGHWLMDAPSGSLPGAETLAREAFQFWLDESTSIETIQHSGPILQEILISKERAI